MTAPTTPRDSAASQRGPLQLVVLVLLVLLALLALPAGVQAEADAAMPRPYRCFSDGAKRPMQPIDQTQPLMGNALRQTRFVVGVLAGSAPVMIILSNSKENDSVTYQLSLEGSTVTIARVMLERLGSTATNGVDVGQLLSGTYLRYFWVEAREGDGGSGTVSFGRAGDEEPMASLRDEAFSMPLYYRFRSGIMWLHSCSSSQPQPQPTLGCRSRYISLHYNFQQTFPIKDEVVTIGDSKAVRFMVKGPKEVHIRLKGAPPSSVYYEIDINFVSKIAIQKGSEYVDITSCVNCLSASEFRLFTVLYNATTISLFEGAALTRPKVTAELPTDFDVASVSFSSMGSAGPVQWLHMCQGERAALPPHYDPNHPAPEFSEPKAPGTKKEVPRPAPGALRPVKLDAAELLGCRVVHTFKYRFDGFFALSEEGYVSGSTTILPFRVMGRKDIHMQLVSTIPPVGEDIYEIDIEFHNHTNLDHGLEPKVASTSHPPLLSPTELRGFVLEHDLATGVLNLTAVEAGPAGRIRGRNLLLWRDPKPFPLRYFSVSSGSSAGNDTTWAFGCPGQHRDLAGRDAARQRTGCSAPLHTYSYSHSQYLSVEREGKVEGSRRTLVLYLRALASGHIRLEAQLPPAVDALLEVDLSHMSNTSIDYLGKRVASERLGSLLSLREARGFWVRQDMAARTLEVGKQGSAQPLLSWTAPTGDRFPEIRFFSLATSRSVGNGTWIYGCKDGEAPTEALVAEEAFSESTETGESNESDESTDATDVDMEMGGPLSVPASKKLWTHVGLLGSKPPANGTAIGLRLRLMRLSFNDITGEAELRGTLQSSWREADLAWEPPEYENIQDVPNLEPGWLWTPKYTVTNGDLELDGLVHVRHTGEVRWEGALHAQTPCRLHARAWPRDQHTCFIQVRLEAETHLRMQLLAAVDAKPRAAHPLWRLEGPVTATIINATGFDLELEPEAEAQYLLISLTLSRASPVLHHLLLAPFVVLAMLCLLAYWVREPLHRDKVLLGALALLLVVFTFIVLEMACPPALVGMPVIVELYCWCMVTAALVLTVSCIMTALAREVPVRRPPALLCTLLSASCVRLLLMLHTDQAEQSAAEYELRPDSVDYVKRSTQVYLRFDQGKASDCTCNNKGCSKQSTVEAQYYWSLLALACERILSIICFFLLLTALVVVKL